jgi:signal transduction histidine kinase
VLLLGEHGASGDGRYGDGETAHRGPVVDEVRVPSATTRTRRRRPGRPARRIPIRYKLAAAMMPPLLIFIVVLGLEVRKIDRQTDEVRRQTELATAADGPSGLLTSLQDEQNWAAVELIGQGGQVTVAVEGYEETRRRTDEALAGFQELLAEGEEQTRQAYANAMDGLEAELEDIRGRIDGNTAERSILNTEFGNAIFESYNRVIQPFYDGITRVALAIDRTDLRRGAELIDTTARQIDAIGNLTRVTIVTSLLSEGGINERHELSDIGALLSRFQRNARELRAKTVGLYADTGDDEMFVVFTEEVSAQVNAAMRGRFNLEDFLATVTVPNEESLNGYRQRVAETLRTEADRLSKDAVWRERIYVFLIALTVAIALVMMLAVSWSITRPLQSLTRQAVEMAHHRLGQAIARVLRTPLGEDVTVPQMEPISVETGDEIADVAEVLNTVQDSALDLAVGQAVMRRNLADSFVNLGRRNQNLLSRQLDFITRLESNETDPDSLSHLFQLDHLATRMRRNAESLLVLAGNESPRKWTAPVRIQDVIRAAVSEVEDYQRVMVRIVEPITIVGTAAADLAHLLAELIENALLFSPSDETVEIRGLTQPAGYTLAVVDSGLGMPPDEIARANRRLAGAESFTVAPSKYLGHYVAGNLAVRHNIFVRLQPSAGAGITATVHIPMALAAATGTAPMLSPASPALGPGPLALGPGTPALGPGGPAGPGAPGGPGAPALPGWAAGPPGPLGPFGHPANGSG